MWSEFSRAYKESAIEAYLESKKKQQTESPTETVLCIDVGGDKCRARTDYIASEYHDDELFTHKLKSTASCVRFDFNGRSTSYRFGDPAQPRSVLIVCASALQTRFLIFFVCV